jgi:ribosome-associated protein
MKDYRLMKNNLKIKIPFSEFHFSFSKSSGAGGQNVNKVNTKATLIWNLTESFSCSEEVKERFKEKYKNFMNDEGEVLISSQLTRSQKGNMDDCIQKLHKMLESVVLPPKPRKKTIPKRSAILKRLETKKKDSEKKKLRTERFD